MNFRPYRLSTGETAGRRRIGGAITASPISGARKNNVTAEEGTVHVIRAGAGLEEIAANDLGEACLATPAAVEGELIFRTKGHLIAIGMGVAERAAPAGGGDPAAPASR